MRSEVGENVPFLEWQNLSYSIVKRKFDLKSCKIIEKEIQIINNGGCCHFCDYFNIISIITYIRMITSMFKEQNKMYLSFCNIVLNQNYYKSNFFFVIFQR